AMQAELLAAVDRRRRRRLVGRSAAALSVVVLLVLVLWPGRVAMPAAPARGPAGPAAIVRVVDDAGIVARLRVAAAPLRATVVRDRPIRPAILLDDDELLRSLREAGQPAGLLRTSGRALLTGPLVIE